MQIIITELKDESELPALFEKMNAATTAWTMRAARGECDWICSDCCAYYSGGMPDECAHGHKSCTEIIERDKRDAVAMITPL